MGGRAYAVSPGGGGKGPRFLVEVEARISARVHVNEADGAHPHEPITVARYAKKWVADRKALGLGAASDDESRLKLHALPTLGDMMLEEVRPRTYATWFSMRKEGKLAPRQSGTCTHPGDDVPDCRRR